MDFEPVGAAAVSAAGFGHADHQTFAQSAGFARCSVLLVHNTAVVVLAFLQSKIQPLEGISTQDTKPAFFERYQYQMLSIISISNVCFMYKKSNMISSKLYNITCITDWLLHVRPKNDLHPSQVNAPKWKPAAGSSHTRHSWFCNGSIWSFCK